jgi:hypothetical protein
MSLPTNFFIGRGGGGYVLNQVTFVPDSSYQQGRLGTPASTMLNNARSEMTNAGNDPSLITQSSNNGRFNITLPAGTTYRIVCYGARGGKDHPNNQFFSGQQKMWGFGRQQTIEVSPSVDTTLVFSMGAHGEDWTTTGDGNNGGSGGGASWVGDINGGLLSMAAGGVGQNSYHQSRSYYHAQPYTAISAYQTASGHTVNDGNGAGYEYYGGGRLSAGGGGGSWFNRARFSTTSSFAYTSDAGRTVAQSMRFGTGEGGIDDGSGVEGGFNGGGYGHNNDLSGGGGGYYGGWENAGSTANAGNQSLTNISATTSDAYGTYLALNAVSYINTGHSLITSYSDNGPTGGSYGSIILESV